jgi:outer-membrane receptor for ferric coprogen and ferric-rhodotorulic acid
LAFIWLALAANAGAADATYEISIGPQALATALNEFGRQSGIQIVFFSRVTDGLSTTGLQGNYSMADALDRLLAGSGLTYRSMSASAVEVKPQSRAERRKAGHSQASGDQSDEILPEVIVKGYAEQLAALRVPTPLREIPQSITVVSREDIRANNSRDLADVIARVPGIVKVRKNSMNPTFYSRGYQVTTFHVDGGAAVNPRIEWAYGTEEPLNSPDLSEYDHIEVLRGADALFGGLGNPGGTVSLVRKRPLHEFAFNASAIVGSWDSQRIEMDVTGPLTEAGNLRGRGGLMASRQEYFFDIAERERHKAYGSIEFDFEQAGTLTVGGSFETDDAKPFVNGLLMYTDGTRPDFPRSQSFMYDWVQHESEMAQAYVQYRQDFGDAWRLKINVFGWNSENEYAFASNGLYVDEDTDLILDTGEAYFSTHPNAERQKSFDITLTGTLDWFGLRQEVAIGADAIHLDLEMDFSRYWAVDGLIPLDAFDPHGVPDPRLTREPWHTSNGHMTLDQTGVFASMRVLFNDAWSAIAGARVNRADLRFKSRSYGTLGENTTDMKADESGVTTAFGGLVYAINGNLSWYASYAEMFQPEDTFSVLSLNEVGTIKGANSETGLKGSWLGGALNASIAAYRITQKNLPVDDPEDPSVTIPGTSRSYGADLEIQGEPAPGWRVGGGYSYNTNDSAAHTGPLSRSTPKHLLKLWADKRLPGALADWSIGGYLHAQTGISATNEDICLPLLEEWGLCEKVTMRDPSYAVLDLRASYELDTNWQLALNLNNVFDKVYNETLGHPFMRTWYGEPRNFTIRLDARF